MNILITGACGGMGSATVKLLQDNHHQIFALDKKINQPIAGVKYYEADITKSDELEKVYSEISKQITNLDVIINFAGIYNLDSLIEISEEEFIWRLSNQ